MKLSDLVRHVADPLDVGVLVTSADLGRPGPTILYANDAFLRMSGYGADDVLGRSPRMLQGEETNPRLINGARRAPPEDVGGTIGFEEFLAITGKPRHRERKAMLTWCGGSIDPEAVPIDLITERMSAFVTYPDSL